MDDSRYLECLAVDYGDLRDAAAAVELTVPVPTCPGWTMGDLVFHVAEVYLSGTLEPDVYVDVERAIEAKAAALRCHQTQLRGSAEVLDSAVRRRVLLRDSEHVCAASEVGASHVLLGSDFPFDISDPFMGDPHEVDTVLGAPGLSAADQKLILGANAAGLLGIKS